MLLSIKPATVLQCAKGDLVVHKCALHFTVGFFEWCLLRLIHIGTATEKLKLHLLLCFLYVHVHCSF